MNQPNVTALARQLARQQAIIAERDAEIAELKQMIDALGEMIDLLLDDSDKREYFAGATMPTPPAVTDATTRLLQTYSDTFSRLEAIYDVDNK